MSDQYIKDILNIIENEKGRPIPVSIILVKLKEIIITLIGDCFINVLMNY